MVDNGFFCEADSQNLIKTNIVMKYFATWSKIMYGAQKSRGYDTKIGYFDFFSGPGMFDSGEKSTAILIAEMCVSDEKLKESVLMMFNDKNKVFSDDLRSNLASIEGIDDLKHKPLVFNKDVVEFRDSFKSTEIIPSLIFIDPFGYKGISLDFIHSVTKDFGCDALLFFNFNRIRAAITNPKVEHLINDIFTKEIADDMRKTIMELNLEDREKYIIDQFATAIRSKNAHYMMIPFRFHHEKKNTTSHYLIFITKHDLGLDIMKSVMANESSHKKDGFASFDFIPTENEQLSFLYNYSVSATKEGLKNELLRRYRGKKIKVENLCRFHGVHTLFTRKNYKDVLKELLSEGKISFHRSNGKKLRKNTMPDDVEI